MVEFVVLEAEELPKSQDRFSENYSDPIYDDDVDSLEDPTYQPSSEEFQSSGGFSDTILLQVIYSNLLSCECK